MKYMYSFISLLIDMWYINLKWHTITLTKWKYVKFDWELYMVTNNGNIPIKWLEAYINNTCVVTGVWKIKILSI